jgi:hypothetical protein
MSWLPNTSITNPPIGVYPKSNPPMLVVKPDASTTSSSTQASGQKSVPLTLPHGGAALDVTSAFNSLLQPKLIAANAGLAITPIYSLENDHTLPGDVIGRGHFGTSQHRETSTDTLAGHTSGFHEVFPTNTFNKLSEEKQNNFPS